MAHPSNQAADLAVYPRRPPHGETSNAKILESRSYATGSQSPGVTITTASRTDGKSGKSHTNSNRSKLRNRTRASGLRLKLTCWHKTRIFCFESRPRLDVGAHRKKEPGQECDHRRFPVAQLQDSVTPDQVWVGTGLLTASYVIREFEFNSLRPASL
jgi:hypothetical protein